MKRKRVCRFATLPAVFSFALWSSMKLNTGEIFEKCVSHYSLNLNGTCVTTILHEGLRVFCAYLDKYSSEEKQFGNVNSWEET
jgi:hypothetical protein